MKLFCLLLLLFSYYCVYGNTFVTPQINNKESSAQFTREMKLTDEYGLDVVNLCNLFINNYNKEYVEWSQLSFLRPYNKTNGLIKSDLPYGEYMAGYVVPLTLFGEPIFFNEQPEEWIIRAIGNKIGSSLLQLEFGSTIKYDYDELVDNIVKKLNACFYDSQILDNGTKFITYTKEYFYIDFILTNINDRHHIIIILRPANKFISVTDEPKAEDANYNNVSSSMNTIDEQHEFPGGQAEIYKWLYENVVYPKEAIDLGWADRVVVAFTIMSDGSVTNVKTIKGLYKSLNEEAERVILNMPKWKPGKHNGKTIQVDYTLSITFGLK